MRIKKISVAGGGMKVLAQIGPPNDGQTVPQSFRAEGDFVNTSSTLTACIDGNGFHQCPMVYPDLTSRTWYADFTDVPCGTDYDLSIDADLEPGDGISVNVCVGLFCVTYKSGKYEKTSIFNPAVNVRVVQLADLEGEKGEEYRIPLKPKLILYSPLTVAVSFNPDPANLDGWAINQVSGKFYPAKISEYPDKTVNLPGANTWNFSFDLPPGDYTLRFTGDNLQAETAVQVVPLAFDQAFCGPHRREIAVGDGDRGGRHARQEVTLDGN